MHIKGSNFDTRDSGAMHSMFCTRMARFAFAALAAIVAAGCSTSGPATPALRLATTTSVEDSGLLGALVPVFEKETGIDVQVVAVGTGQALEIARRGDADLVLTHAPDAEHEFVAAGDGIDRRELMHNAFIVVGPPADPAGVAGSPSVAEAFRRIAGSQATFVSRGDESGTHLRERALWKEAQIEPRGDWYIQAGTGMAATLRLASERKAYTLSDRGTFLSQRNKLELSPLPVQGASLRNQYSVTLVNPQKHARLNHAGATRFAAFLFRPDIQHAISEFCREEFGESLFVAAADHPQKGLPVQRTAFGKTPDGTETHLFTITNSSGASLVLLDYGATIVEVNVPDRQGRLANVTLGFDTLDKYQAHTAHFGSTTGRFANRIARGRFTLEGREYQLAVNNGPNHLHGGLKGFDRRVWQSEAFSAPAASGVRFSYRSPDGEESYPGTLDATVTISLTDANAIVIDYLATTDRPTVLNLTNHAYWNLAGAGSGTILRHRLLLNADQYLPVDAGLIPTGEAASVKGTCMDFTTPHEIGERLGEMTSRDLPTGYDHCYILRNRPGEAVLAARVEEPVSGRVMEVQTTEPAVQLYTGNFLDGGAENGGHRQHTAFCLETQHYPDSPNQPQFPTTELKPGESFRSTSIYRFSAK